MEPLASQIRPLSLSDYVGQKHLVGDNKPLKIAIESSHLFSFLLWGPPGVGKTTLARIYANSIDSNYHELSAVSAKKDEIKSILKLHEKSNKPTILLLDEIHRFNKAQQDFLLPYVETGKLTLIGATTENPSFEVIPALLSRCRVFIIEELKNEDMSEIINRTGADLDQKAKDWLIQMANGDARQAITMIENTLNIYKKITVETLKESLQNKYLRYDKKGEEHYNTISAYIKSMRASSADAALYYLARMIDSGEDPKFIARRMVIFASEDIGIAQPSALIYANEVFRAVETIGLPECQINLAHGTVLLAKAPKNRSACDGFFKAMKDVKDHGNLPIPMNLRNTPTKFMEEIGYGKGYEKYTKEDLLPDKLKGTKYI
ncbi:AAA family ATPase [candidate division WWE3 bacterium CG_4_9_14_0_2_um_filter_35_11]|uniref:AAA family ATPase n=1 Tax=candidate division WWE3 bacterium CG_4_9_14_0_2_um_filter_35_11 TaxID=1975077 RepID=A0A2M8EKR6_UNCKA|nr:MAG: AAA family ATPase [candidate division WWE3 bacterium CG_4_9_14_0_2_um_filter_35_11]